jgi:hypothetical protein
MWLGANVAEMWHMGMAQGRGEDDFTSLIRMIEEWAGVVVGGNESGPINSSSPAKAGDPVNTR